MELSETLPFSSGGLWLADFSDVYAMQYWNTIQWLQRELERLSMVREARRSVDPGWIHSKRQTLEGLVGFNLAVSESKRMVTYKLTSNYLMYEIENLNGVIYTGESYLPPSSPWKGCLLFWEPSYSSWTGQSPIVDAYLKYGLVVIRPYFPLNARSLSGREDELKWYNHADDELLHYLSFVVGGSLVGLQVAELLCLTKAFLGEIVKDGKVLGVDLRGRNTLTGMVFSALAPEMVNTIVLDSDQLIFIDRQEKDAISNTIWSFHREFDALTLMQLARGVNLVFLERGAVPSIWYSRVSFCMDQTSPPGGNPSGGNLWRLPKDGPPSEFAAKVAETFEQQEGIDLAGLASLSRAGAKGLTEQELYLRALLSKISFLSRLHSRAREARYARYDFSRIDNDEYRRRIQESIEAVCGPQLPEAARSRVYTRHVERHALFDTYEVLLESVSGILTAGILRIPNDREPHPAVICQHGLLGRPEHLADHGEHWNYYGIARLLAEKGYVTYAPFMNWGWGGTPARDRLTKHTYAMGYAPNRFEVAQLHAIVDFLQSRPEVKADKIGFYGLSYGGYASLWLAAQEPRLACVITAGHFNDWQDKLVSLEVSPPCTRPTSYMTVNEGADMFMFDVLNQLGHAELASLNAPRPYMVENGLRDAVTPTKWVEREYERAKRIYEWLGHSEAIEIEHFDGPHRIWGEGSLKFLHKYLK